MPIPIPGGEDAKVFLLEQYGGLNTKAKRTAIADNEFSWLENVYPIGDGNLRTIYDKGATLYTTTGGRTILHYVPFNIGSSSYIAVFLDNGTAVQVNVDTAATTTITAVANTFYNASSIPAAAQWKSELLVIVGDAAANGYWLWNGSKLFGAGGLSPDIVIANSGRNYSSAPTVTAYGGAGSGATFSATVANGAVTEVTCTDPGSGYVLNDQPVLAFSGGGSDAGAAIIPTVTVTSGGIASVEIINPGQSFNLGGDGRVTFTGGGGAGAAGIISAASNGAIYGVTVTNPGTGYTSAPVVTIDNAGGSNFSAIAHVTRGQVTAFTVAAGGTGYDAPPTMTIVGDGVGATAVAVLTAGVVSSATIVNAGLGYTYAKVLISNGNDAASATCSLMPFGIKGNTVETYQSRVFVGNGTKAHFTAPATTSSFATSQGGGSYPATEAFLRRQITRFLQSNGFLYQIGDSSINVISNVQTAGNPPSTTFSNQNVDPQVGTNWPNTAQAFGRAIVFANPLGVYALYGGAAEKVSDALDGLFEKGTFNTGEAGLTPTASIATIFGIRCYCLLFTTTDKYSGSKRNIMCLWDGRKWFVGTQSGSALKEVNTQEINSVISTWATDGTTLFKAFQTASTSLTKVWQTKLRPGDSYIAWKQFLRFYMVAESNHADGATLNVAVDSLEATNGYTAGTPVAVPVTFTTTPKVVGFDAADLDVYGQFLGVTGTTVSKDVTIMSQSLLYTDYAPEA